jgi:hypothetical protein
LIPYGIEIYAVIDAYFRYIVWIYIGIFGMIAVSVFRQYLDVIAVHKSYPQFVRFDYGKETLLLADAQLQIRRADDLKLLFENTVTFGRNYEN